MQHLNPDPSPSAATAAAQAFLANRASNAALSAAAAAAALRAHATTPVSVGEVQTKRRLQRQSFSSPGGDAASTGESSMALRRRASSSSMADRSFRSQSPKRAASVSSIDAPPPVPALPKDIPPVPSSRISATRPRPATSGAPAPTPSHKPGRRASSVEATVSRIASPAHAASHGRGMSVDRARATSPGVLAAQRAASMAPASERGVISPDSRASVNFSYPISPRSPTPSIDERRSNANAAPNQLSPPARLNSPPPAASPGASGPVKGKKKKAAAERSQATSPASISSGANLPGSGTVTPSDTGSPISSPKQRKKAAVGGAKLAGSLSETSSLADHGSSAMAYHSDLDTISENGDEPERPAWFKTRAAALLVKQPSVVRENRELEAEEGSDAQLNQPIRLDGDSARENQTAQPRQDRRFTAPSTPQSGAQHARSASQPINMPATPANADKDADSGRSISGGQDRDTVRGARPQSLSPTRYAHFVSTPPTLSPLVIKHEPPPRSLSPAKSALRKATSSRPSSAGSQASNVVPGSVTQNPNGIFDSPVSPDADRSSTTSKKKKKGSRVSFDSDSVVVNNDSTTELQPTRISNGNPESPVADKPTSGRRAVSSEAEEEFLKPRPALPLFGSIRRQKDPVRSSSGVASVGGPAPKETSPRLAQPLLGTSSDHAIGGIIAQDFTARSVSGLKATGLPPDLQAVEPTSSAAAPIDETFFSLPAKSDNPGGPAPRSPVPLDVLGDYQLQGHPVTGPNGHSAASTNAALPLDGEPQNDIVPSIEFTQPTPNPEAAEPFIGWGQDQVGVQPPKASGLHDILHDEQPRPGSISSGVAVEDRPGDLGFPKPRKGLSTQDPPAQVTQHEEEDEDSEDTDGSRYSDAAEDVSEPEDGGFGSIDAVVDTTPADVLPGVAITTPPESATPIDANGKPAGSDNVETYKNGVAAPGGAQVDQSMIPSVNGSPVQIPAPKVKKRKKANPNIDGAGEVAVARSVVIRAPPAKQTPRLGAVTNGVSTGNGTVKSPTTSGPTLAAQEASRYTRHNSLPGVAAPKKVTVVAPRGKSISEAPAKDQFSEAVRKEIQNLTATAGAAGALGPSKKSRAKMPLTRSDSNSSASSSSFRKIRARRSAGAVGPSDGSVALRRSMRPASQSGPVGGGSMSVRSLSPAGSATPRTMKTSLRGTQSPRAAPSLRPLSADAGKSTSSPFRAFGKARKAKAAAAPSRFGNKASRRRYSDSSDDGPRAPPVFRSRFEDSSDDEEGVAIAVPLTPVRGIPRRIGEADDESSELADSSDNEGDGGADASPPAAAAAAAAAQSQNVATVRHGHESQALVAGTLRQKARPSPAGSISSSKNGDYSPSTKKKRRSLFGVLGRRKHDASKDAAAAAASEQLQLQQQGGSGDSGAVNGSAAAGRQRPVRQLSTVDELESWPIPPGLPGDLTGAGTIAPTTTTTITAEQRPSTSDGVSSRRLPWVRRRPHFGVRRTTNPSMSGGLGGGDSVRVANSDTAVPSSSSMRHRRGSHYPEVYGRNGKKKRFGMLRRAFGLVD